MVQPTEQTPVFILCGGLGTRIKEETEFRPKPMVPIGNHPILWHIMHIYRRNGFKKFVLCTGFKSEVIKSYFLNYSYMNSDFSINLEKNKMTVHSIHHKEDWNVTIAYTGEKTMTGGRIAMAAEKYLGDSPHFAVTYGDGLCNANLHDEFAFHLSHGKTGTILGVNPPSRFGEIHLQNNEVIKFVEKPEFSKKWINGGFFFFKREFIDQYLEKSSDCILEKTPLVRLAEDGELQVYKHRGFWSCMDTQRDRDHLNELWKTGKPPWLLPANALSQGSLEYASIS